MRLYFDRGTLKSPNGWKHGDRHDTSKWPAWRIFSWQIINMAVSSNRSVKWGRRLWVYTRRKAYNLDIILSTKENL